MGLFKFLRGRNNGKVQVNEEQVFVEDNIAEQEEIKMNLPKYTYKMTSPNRIKEDYRLGVFTIPEAEFIITEAETGKEIMFGVFYDKDDVGTVSYDVYQINPEIKKNDVIDVFYERKNAEPIGLEVYQMLSAEKYSEFLHHMRFDENFEMVLNDEDLNIDLREFFPDAKRKSLGITNFDNEEFHRLSDEDKEVLEMIGVNPEYLLLGKEYTFVAEDNTMIEKCQGGYHIEFADGFVILTDSGGVGTPRNLIGNKDLANGKIREQIEEQNKKHYKDVNTVAKKGPYYDMEM